MGRYHLYQRTVKQADGTSGKIWYYWFYGPNGARVRRTTGCEIRRQAEDVVAGLEVDAEEAATRAAHPRALVRDIADPMFKEGAAHLRRWGQKGRTMVQHTIDEHRRNIEKYILPEWGSRWIDEIQGPDLEDWLVDLLQFKDKSPLAGSTKNGIALTFLMVFTEAKRAGFIEAVPELELFARRGLKKDVLLDAELELLFPECPGALSLIWGRRPVLGRTREEPEIGIMFGALYAFSVSAGLRPGEGRATHLDQLYEAVGGMIVDRAFDSEGTLGAPKKSRENDPRYRVVYLPDRTWRILKYWTSRRREEAPDFPGLLFPFHGHSISSYYLDERFELGLKNAGIKQEGRRLSPHSLRYTYNGKMRGVLSGDVLREFIGHRSEAMTDHYDRMNLRPILEARLTQLADQRPAVERFWEK
jgi:integrase